MTPNIHSNKLAIDLCGVTLPNPVIAASGTFGFGREYNTLFPVGELGAISSKGLTLEPRAGNPPPRVAECPAGMLNAVGLQNPGVERFLADELPWMKEQGAVVIANIAGNTADEYRTMAERLDGSAVDLLEVNISCPNVKAGGIQFGTTCDGVGTVTAAVRAGTKKPVMVKLSPNVTDITDMAAAAEAAGADAVSLINTLLGMRIDIRTRRPILHNNMGGLSGPAVFPVALRMVWQVARRVGIPVVGMGGIATWQDAVEMMMAGARAIQVGTAIFRDPFALRRIVEGLRQYADAQNLNHILQIVGAVEAY